MFTISRFSREFEMLEMSKSLRWGASRKFSMLAWSFHLAVQLSAVFFLLLKSMQPHHPTSRLPASEENKVCLYYSLGDLKN